MDLLSPEQRSKNMGSIRSKGMKPELEVRKLVHRLGYRYRLHVKVLPGKPDLVFASRRKIIQVHGCFWHQHKDPKCRIVRIPKSNTSYWAEKLRSNFQRDRLQEKQLAQDNWLVLIIWECQVRNKDLASKIVRFLDS